MVIILSKNHDCILRRGVENNKNFSFIACLADLYHTYGDTKEVLSIHQMRLHLAECLSLDLFIQLQNGNLIKIFSSNKEVNIDEYSETKLYDTIDTSSDDQMIFLATCISSYENFLDYLKNGNDLIDHTYLWDLVCTPNQKLFQNGLNLIILEIPQDDATDNIELICPTNHYAYSLYDQNKSSFILVKYGKFYEPIYIYNTGSGKTKILKTFTELDQSLHKNLKTMLDNVKRIYLK